MAVCSGFVNTYMELSLFTLIIIFVKAHPPQKLSDLSLRSLALTDTHMSVVFMMQVILLVVKQKWAMVVNFKSILVFFAT